MRIRWWVSLIILSLSCLLATLGPWRLWAEAAVLISPARLEAVVGADGRGPQLRLLNRGADAVHITLRLVGGGHDLDGMPRLDESGETGDEWARRLHLESSELFLGPGELATVGLSVAAGEAGGLYPAIVADIASMGEKAGSVIARTRIAIPVLLTVSGASSSRNGSGSATTGQDVKPVTVRVDQEVSGGPLSIDAVLANDGRVHVRTGARVVIEGPDVLEEVLLAPVTILPGLARRIHGEWMPSTLPEGQYVVRLVPDSPRSTTDAAVVAAAFEVVLPYELARVRPAIELFAVDGAVASQLSVRAVVANRGNTTGEALLSVEITDMGGHTVTRQEWVLTDLAPQVGRPISEGLPLAGVAPGQYVVAAELWHDGRQVAEARRLTTIELPTVAVRRGQ